MAQQPVNAMYSFQFLVDSTSEWQTTITSLIAHVSQRHEEFKAEYSRLVNKIEKRKRSASTCSVRSTDDQRGALAPLDDVSTSSPAAQTSDLTEVSPFEAGTRFLFAQARRKQRRAGASIRSNMSGPSKCRNTPKVVIHYDKHVQLELEKLVRGFGNGRNNLRKGKNAYIASRGFKLPSLSRNRRLDDEGTTPALSKFSGNTVLVVTDAKITDMTGEAAFISVDKELEAAQQLCETAAHQVIRDGDCQLQLKDVLTKLAAMRDMASSAVESLKKKEEERALAERISEFIGTDLPHKPAKCSMPLPRSLPNSQQSKSSTLSSPTSVDFTPGMLASSIIEIDSIEESTESSTHLDLKIADLRSAARASIRA
ncbi:hypothetical protein LTR66_016976 [Elasticomyces elasticus]|nr:hypothetical protein LTR66_016976 [Elasticomyces elasticus]